MNATVEKSAEPKARQDRLGLPLRMYGHFLRVSGILLLILYVLFAVLGVILFLSDESTGFDGFNGSLAAVLDIVSLTLNVGTAVGMFVLGRAIVRGNKRNVAVGSRILLWLTAVEFATSIMQSGISWDFLLTLVQLVVLTALSLKIDPALTEERRVKSAQAVESDVLAAQAGTLGRDKTGKGYLSLNFYNIFWVFVVSSIIGLILETIWHPLMVEPGVIQDRAGMLYGPFSPIYGFGAVLMTVALNRLYDKNPIFIFLASAVIGGAFEFFVSWFFESAFGITAWDYTGTFLSIDGRTNGFFMAMWGVMGLVWIKLVLPYLLRGINLIPVRRRGVITTVCAALMLANGIMTLQSIDCWFMRVSGIPATTPIEEFYDRHYGNEVMQARFESMTIVPTDSARIDVAARN